MRIGVIPGCRVISFALLAACTPGLWAGDGFVMPEDPPGVTPVDRSFEWLGNAVADYLYAFLYMREGVPTVLVYAGDYSEEGVVWRLLHEWEPCMDGYPVPIAPNAVLEVLLDEFGDGSAVFTIIDNLEVYEGKVCIYLWIDLETGEFQESWSD
jgi:hypothetical protein